MEIYLIATKKANSKKSGIERKDGTHKLFVQKGAVPTLCFFLDRWENEGGAVPKKTASMTR